MGTIVGSAQDSAKIAGGCPDMSSMTAIAKINFEDEFSLDAKSANQVKAGVIAAGALKDLSASIDADLLSGCGGLAKDLGDTTAYRTGTEACKGAIKAMGDARAKIGASASIALEVKEPVCSASIALVADCAGKCDASLKGGKADVKCEGGELSGKCDAKCSGECKMSAVAACDGTCEGTCDADFSGSCEGHCEGTCDGEKDAKGGACRGTCKGKCDSKGKGQCSGNCNGSCQMSGGAKCDGTCTGSCSVDFKEPACSGTVVSPKVSAECKASCDAESGANLSCTPAGIGVKITGAKNAEAAAKYKAALEADLPRILKVAIGMLPKLGSVLTNVSATLQGAVATGKAAASGRATAGAHITQCLLTPFAGALSAVADIKASMSVSVDVKASASASTSGTGKAG